MSNERIPVEAEPARIAQIRQPGLAGPTQAMASSRRHTIPR